MAMYIMKGLCVIGILLNVILMIRKNKELRANPEKDPGTGMTGEELWKQGMKPKNLVATIITGFVANFLDTLGIGSFAPSSASFKLTKSVDDILVPGTLNVGDTVPVCVEAFLFFGFVDMDILTLVLMIAASVIGSFVMADIVTKFDRKKVRYALFVGLFILATVILMKVFAIGPFGTIGTELGLRGVKLVIAVVGNFVFGALMSIGVGLYAPCMAMVLALGMDAGCAFPAMMGSCAYLMAFGNGPKFIAQGRYDMVACWTQAIFGAIGVYCAYAFVSSLPLDTLTKVIAVIVYITAFLYLHDAIKKGSAA
ncbi:permease [uncultured Merdimonas sp.]|uniref:permease n=1 Tax=uncultured Merdimonas sp. TaxID=2023269 RepID=UPI003207F99F